MSVLGTERTTIIFSGAIVDEVADDHVTIRGGYLNNNGITVVTTQISCDQSGLRYQWVALG